MMIYHSGVVGQTTPELILPEHVNGTVQLYIGSFPNQNLDSLGPDELAVYVNNEYETYHTNFIQGRYSINGNYLVFVPYFPFENGISYVVRTRNIQDMDNFHYRSFQLGKEKLVEEAKVASIYPSATELPENLLRIYLYFNTPMQRGQALKHIPLIDEKGNIDQHAFMEFKQEQWSLDGKRLTLLFDPGRIKRGVSTNLSRGPALLEGKRYELCIAGEWQDVYGQELSEISTKEIIVVPAYRNHIKVKEWKIDQPNSGSYEKLSIAFDRIMDHALIQSMIRLEDREKKLVKGHWEILDREKLIQFIPEEKWQKGKYIISMDYRLEDVAGNNLQNLLDHKRSDNENNNQLFQYIEIEL